MAISVACMAICLPTPGFKWRTFKLCVLNKWDFNFCVRSSPLRGPIMDNMFSPPTCDTYFQISCRGFSPSTPVCSLSLWFRSIRLWNEVVCLLVFWAQSAASRGYIRAEYELLIYLSVTQHTSHLTSTTIFLQHNYVKHTHTDTRTYTQTHTHTISIKKTHLGQIITDDWLILDTELPFKRTDSLELGFYRPVYRTGWPQDDKRTGHISAKHRPQHYK